jgi:hypothetical protein
MMENAIDNFHLSPFMNEVKLMDKKIERQVVKELDMFYTKLLNIVYHHEYTEKFSKTKRKENRKRYQHAKEFIKNNKTMWIG